MRPCKRIDSAFTVALTLFGVKIVIVCLASKLGNDRQHMSLCVVPRTSICHYQNVEPSETVSTNGVLVRCEESKRSWNLVENPLHAILELGRKYIRLVVNADDLERQHST